MAGEPGLCLCRLALCFRIRASFLDLMLRKHSYFCIVVPLCTLMKGAKMFMQSMKDWEQRQELKEMAAMGEGALFLMSTPVDATPVEKKIRMARRRRGFSPLSILGWLTDKSQLLRVFACVGYLLPLLNVPIALVVYFGIKMSSDNFRLACVLFLHTLISKDLARSPPGSIYKAYHA